MSQASIERGQFRSPMTGGEVPEAGRPAHVDHHEADGRHQRGHRDPFAEEDRALEVMIVEHVGRHH
jgi:hypothetical protein